MSTVDVPTFKKNADQLIALAIAGQGTVIELNGRRAVLLPCPDAAPDFEMDPVTDQLLSERVRADGKEPTDADWLSLRQAVLNK